jgi:hypothetical protein
MRLHNADLWLQKDNMQFNCDVIFAGKLQYVNIFIFCQLLLIFGHNLPPLKVDFLFHAIQEYSTGFWFRTPNTVQNHTLLATSLIPYNHWVKSHKTAASRPRHVNPRQKKTNPDGSVFYIDEN